jgi:hypothetical protein
LQPFQDRNAKENVFDSSTQSTDSFGYFCEVDRIHIKSATTIAAVVWHKRQEEITDFFLAAGRVNWHGLEALFTV